MKKKEAIKLILEYYYNCKTDKLWAKTAYAKGHLCAIRYILINVYEFKDNDKRF